MNLRDKLFAQIEAKNLSEPFTLNDVRQIKCEDGTYFEKKCLPIKWETILANFSVGPGSRQGQAVQTGSLPLFTKHKKKGSYSLLWDDSEVEHDPCGTAGVGNYIVEPIRHDITDSVAIARKFVEYLREKPLVFLTTRGTHHPELIWNTPARSGWWQRVNSYSWKGVSWHETQHTVGRITSKLSEAEDLYKKSGKSDHLMQLIKEIYDEIRAWGNPRGASRDGDVLLEMLIPLWTDLKITEVDSTLTKLYALARPNEFVIYDSRVATAILSIAEDIYRIKNQADTVETIFRSSYPNLGRCDVGSGGTRPRGTRSTNWPVAYRSVAAQYDANNLCCAIRDQLNQLNEPRENNGEWTLREVEAVLFMEGY